MDLTNAVEADGNRKAIFFEESTVALMALTGRRPAEIFFSA
jgi:hypothetical protein